MTNDDTLLAGFLDRSLSEDQLLELEARKAASPEFAHQFSNMLTLESMLVTAAPKATVSAHFLHTVENTVAAKVLAGGAAGGLLSGLSSAWAWLGGAALALVSVGSIYYFNQPAPQPVVQVTPKTVLAQPTDEGAATLAEPTSTVIAEPIAVPVSPKSPVAKTDGGSSSTAEMTSVGGEDAVLITVKEYEAHVTSADHVNATLKALTLGNKYRADKDFARSEDYFAKAVEHARKAKLVKEEIRALGEQALTSIARGNESQARLLLNQAILRGSQTGIDVSVWTQKLKDLQ